MQGKGESKAAAKVCGEISERGREQGETTVIDCGLEVSGRMEGAVGGRGEE